MEWMDLLRGAAILLVISHHSLSAASLFLDDAPMALRRIDAFFAPFRMPMLMFLSGMLLSRSLQKPPRQYVLGKLANIGWPYLLWSFVFLAVSGALTLTNSLRVAVFPPTYLWFLWFLLAFYVAAWVLVKWRIPLWAVASASLVISAVVPDMARAPRFFYLFVFFLAGHLYMIHKDKILPALTRAAAWVLCSVVGLGTAVVSATGVSVQYAALFAPGVIAALGALLVLAPRVPLAGPTRGLTYLGRNSIVLYVTHWPVLWVLADGYEAAGLGDPWVLYGVGIAVAVAVGCTLAWLRTRTQAVSLLFALPTGRRATTLGDPTPRPRTRARR